MRALPPDAMKYAAQIAPSTVERLVSILENQQVTLEMARSSRRGNGSTSPRGANDAGPPRRLRDRPGDLGQRNQEWYRQGPDQRRRDQDDRRCFSCGKEGHISWSCPGREESMPSAAETPTSAPHCLFITS